MDMAVECESCRSRFRLNASLLKQSKAVRFRCRKCGGFIMVRNPHAPRIIPVSSVPPKIAAPPAATAISPAVRPKIEPPTPKKTPVPPPTMHAPSNAVPAPPALPIPPVPRLEDLVVLSPGKDVVPVKASTPRRPSPARNHPRRRVVDPPSGRGRPLLRNHGGRAGTAGQLAPFMGICASGECRRETCLRRSGIEVHRPSRSQSPAICSWSAARW